MMYHGFNTNNMTKLEAKQSGYTHNGLMYGFIPIYIKHDYWDIDVVGKNRFLDLILDVFIFVDNIFSMTDGFCVWEGDEL